MFFMYDSVTLDQVPKSPHAVACYVNGRYANHAEAKQRFPHAHILTISVEGENVADCYDVENGDYKPSDVPALLALARKHNVWRPCFYANLSTMPAVREVLNKHVTKRDEIRLWVASYDNLSIIPDGYDAKQFTDRALGRNLDESVCESTFFNTLARKPVADKVVSTTIEYNETVGKWALRY